MVALPQQFNTADFPDSNIAPLIEPGQYKAVIVKGELLDNKRKDGKFVALTIVIAEGKFANTEFTERLNIINPNETAVRIAHQTLARISEAVGMTQTPNDTDQLNNKPFIIDVKTAPATPYKDKDGVEKPGNERSEIKKYLPLQDGVTPAAGAVTTAPATMPWGNR